jgi:hypothetical protein
LVSVRNSRAVNRHAIGELNKARQADEETSIAQGILSGRPSQPQAAPSQQIQQPTQPSAESAPQADFSGVEDAFSTSPDDELSSLAPQGTSFGSPATPALRAQLDQMQSGMTEQGGTPPGGAPPGDQQTLGQLFAGGGTSAPVSAPPMPASGPIQITQGLTEDEKELGRQQAAEVPPQQSVTPQPVAPAAPTVSAAAETDPKKTPEFWLDAAGQFEAMGPQFKTYADQARAQAKALGEAGEAGVKVQAGKKKAADESVDDEAKAESAVTGIDETLGLLNELRTHPGLYVLPGNIPFGGEIDIRGTSVSVADLFPGSNMASFFNKHKTLVSNVALRTMQELKALSSQGATGFGALSQKELKVLEDSAGALQLTNKPEDLIKAYDKFMDHLTAARGRIAERYQAKYGTQLNIGAAPERLRVKSVTRKRDGSQLFHPDMQR